MQYRPVIPDKRETNEVSPTTAQAFYLEDTQVSSTQDQKTGELHELSGDCRNSLGLEGPMSVIVYVSLHL